MRRLPLGIVALFLVVLLSASSAHAKYAVAVGLGDESSGIFVQPHFQSLGIKKVRYFIRWDAMRVRYAREAADNYVAEARMAGAQVLMHVSTNDLRHGRATLPSVATYRTWVGKLVRHYRAMGVTDWGVWNEANHISQPTYKNPARAAQYFLEMRRLCPGCHIVALDILDQAGATTYIKRFYAALGSRRGLAAIVGIHNYSDTNRFRDLGTTAIIKAVKRYNRRTIFWLTETGGVVSFGRAFPCSTSRAARAIKYMFTLVKRHRADIKRLYAYNYFGTAPKACIGFDAGLVSANDTPRAGYKVFAQLARDYTR
jgi:hypothetical protein